MKKPKPPTHLQLITREYNSVLFQLAGLEGQVQNLEHRLGYLRQAAKDAGVMYPLPFTDAHLYYLKHYINRIQFDVENTSALHRARLKDKLKGDKPAR